MLDLQRIRLLRYNNTVPHFLASQLFQVLAQHWPGRSPSGDFCAGCALLPQAQGCTLSTGLAELQKRFSAAQARWRNLRQAGLQKRNACHSQAKRISCFKLALCNSYSDSVFLVTQDWVRRGRRESIKKRIPACPRKQVNSKALHLCIAVSQESHLRLISPSAAVP